MNKTHVICRQVVSDRDSVQDEEPHCWVGRRRRALQTMPATSYPIHTDTPPSSQPSWWKIWHPNWQPNISRPCSNLHSTIAMLQLHWLMIGNGKLSFVLKTTLIKLLQSCNNLTSSLTHKPTWYDDQFPSHEVQQNCMLCPRLYHKLWRAYDCLKGSHKLSTGCTLTDLTAFGQH